MTISTNDLKLRTPERLTDLADGGGRQTSGTVVDGELNNIFQDTSRLDRVTGRCSLRKVFMHVDTLNVDTLLGAHVIAILAQLDAVKTVRLGHPTTTGGVGYLVAAGLMTQAQADVVLAYEVPAVP